MTEPPKSSSLPILIGVIAVVVVLCGRALGTWGSGDGLPLLGAPNGEVWGHAWVQWWHAEAWPAWPDGPSEWVTTTRDWPVIDPLPTALAATVGALVGSVVAYDLVVVLGLAGAFVGGAVLARATQGNVWVGALAVALAPAYLGSVASGLTEDLALGLAAVGLGWVGSADWRRALGAGVCLGLLAASGLVLAWMAAVVAVGLGLWALVKAPDRRPVGTGLVIGGLVAGLLALPGALMHADRLSGTGHRLGQFIPRPEPLWRLNPWKGTDLASFLVPGPVDPGDALVRMHPGYLGLSLLLLALWAGRSRWWLVLAGAVLLAPGPHLSVAGTPTGIENPAVVVLQVLPFGDLINHHGRFLLIGAVALAVLAAKGTQALEARFGRRAAWGAVAVVALDLALLGPVGAPLPVADPTPLAVYTHPDFAALPDGALLSLPAAGPGVHFQRPLLDQRAHGRPLALDPNRPGLPPGFARTDTGRFLSTLAGPEALPVPDTPTWPAGVAVVVVAEPHVDAVISLWGPPTVQAPDSAAWVAP